MTEWAGFKDTVSMDNLCYYLGIDTPKHNITGATFGKAWEECRYDEMNQYALDEITALKAVYKRLA
jgi:hypothetical protein